MPRLGRSRRDERARLDDGWLRLLDGRRLVVDHGRWGKLPLDNIVALIGIHRVASRYAPPSTVRLAVWLAALGPLSFVFSMVYTESLALLLICGSFLLLEQRRVWAASAVGAVRAHEGARLRMIGFQLQGAFQAIYLLIFSIHQRT